MNLLMISGDRSILQGKKGAFWYTLEVLSKHWDRIDVVVPKARGLHPDTHPFGNVWFHPSPCRLWYQPWWILKKGGELFRAHHQDVMTVQEYPPFYNGLGTLWLHRATKVPYMVEIHHIVGYPRAASFQEWIGFRISRVWLPKWGTLSATTTRVVSNELYFFLPQWGIPEKKIALLPSFYLDCEKLVPDPTIAKQYDVACCARLVKNKGLPELLRAVAKLQAVTLLIIGDGPERRNLENLSRLLGIADRVTFAGWLSQNTDVYRAMQTAKIFVMNSRSEGGPRVLFEAMALGLPVISTRVGNAPNTVIERVSGLFTSGDQEDLSGKISLFLRDDVLREELGRKAQVVRDTFSRAVQIESYADALKDITRL